MPKLKSKPPTAFVSYSTADRVAGAEVKRLLALMGIGSFLAHDDLQVSEAWETRILQELRSCSVFIALLSRAFRKSKWAPQEVGVIVGRGDVPIVPLSLDDTLPFGFIARVQGRRLKNGEVSADVLLAAMLKADPHLVIPGMIQSVADAGSFRGAEAVMKPLVPLFPLLNRKELHALIKASTDNGQVWDAALCRTDYLPQLLEMHRDRMRPMAREALEYQVEHARWFPRREDTESE